MRNYPPAPRYLFRRYEILRHLKPGKKFLEIGAGNFQLSIELLNYFNTGVSLDFHPDVDEVYASLSADFKKRLEVRKTDFLTTDFNETYDCIVACEVMEHVHNDADFLNKILQLLKPKGQIIISVPARMKYWSTHDEIAGHIKRYEKDEVLNLFDKFQNVKVVSYGYPFVNLLRFARIMLAKRQYKERQNWNQKQLTTKSGMETLPSFLRFLVNKKVFLPFNLFARFFNNFDLSEGYLVIAEN